jgi:hypothetical protein
VVVDWSGMTAWALGKRNKLAPRLTFSRQTCERTEFPIKPGRLAD